MTIRNTSQMKAEELLSGMLKKGSSNFIESMEARGQFELAVSQQLPTELIGCTEAQITQMGVKLGKPVEGDPLFRHAELPKGWQKVPTDHDMWSDLVDAKGRKRGGIFYKAAFYDRKAHLSLTRRFSIEQDYAVKEPVCVMNVKDGDTVLFTLQDKATGREYLFLPEKLRKRCVDEYLKVKWPEWENPSAYWED